MKITLWCGETSPKAKMMNDPENADTTPVPCKGPDCPKFDGGWCIHLLNGRTYEAVSAEQPSP
jgi:hypothetical protein